MPTEKEGEKFFKMPSAGNKIVIKLRPVIAKEVKTD